MKFLLLQCDDLNIDSGLVEQGGVGEGRSVRIDSRTTKRNSISLAGYASLGAVSAEVNI